MRTLKLFVVPSLFLVLLLTGSAGAEEPSDSERVAYKFTPGQSAKYRLKLRHDIRIEGEKKDSNVVTQSFVFARKVEKVRATGVSLSLTFPEVRVRYSPHQPEFDSRNKEQVEAAKQPNSNWRMFGAMLTSKVSMRVKESGEVSFFRLKSLAKEYDDEQMRFYVGKAVEAVKNHAFLLLQDVEAKKGAIWKTTIPVKFMGGPLSGRDVYVPITLRLRQVDVVDGKRLATFDIASHEHPKLEISADSLKGIEVDLKAGKASGSAVFSLDDGAIKSYAFKIETSLKLSASGQVVLKHNMKVDAELERL